MTALHYLYLQTEQSSLYPDFPMYAAREMMTCFHTEFTRAIAYGKDDEIIYATVQLLGATFRTCIMLGGKAQLMRAVQPRTLEDKYYTSTLAVVELEKALQVIQNAAAGKEGFKQYKYPVRVIDLVYTIMIHLRIPAGRLEDAMMGIQA